MSARNSAVPWPVKLLIFAGVATVAAFIASELLGYLSTTSAAPEGVGWWVPALSVGMPVAVVVSILIYLWMIK